MSFLSRALPEVAPLLQIPPWLNWAIAVAIGSLLIGLIAADEIEDFAARQVNRLFRGLGAGIQPIELEKRVIGIAERTVLVAGHETIVASRFAIFASQEVLARLGGHVHLAAALTAAIRDAGRKRGWTVPLDLAVGVHGDPSKDAEDVDIIAYGGDGLPFNSHRRPILALCRGIARTIRRGMSECRRVVHATRQLSTVLMRARRVAYPARFRAAAGLALIVVEFLTRLGYLQPAIHPSDPFVVAGVAAIAVLLEFLDRTDVVRELDALLHRSVRLLRPWTRAFVHVFAAATFGSATLSLVLVVRLMIADGPPSSPTGSPGVVRATPAPVADLTSAAAATSAATPSRTAAPTPAAPTSTPRPPTSSSPPPPPRPTATPAPTLTPPPRTPEPTGRFAAGREVRWHDQLVQSSTVTGVLEAGQTALVTSGDGLVAGFRCRADRAGRMCAFMISATTRYGYRVDELVPGHAWAGQTLGSYRSEEILQNKIVQFFEPGSCGPVACEDVTMGVSINARHVCVVEISRGRIIAVALVLGAESLCPAEFVAAMREQPTTRYLLEWWVPPEPLPCGVIVSSSAVAPPREAVGTRWLIHADRVTGHLAELAPAVAHCAVARRS